MSIEKVLLETSAETLVERAGDCFDLAKIQHSQAEKEHETASMQTENANKQLELADQQHVDADNLAVKADKLEALGHALVADAVEIKGDTLGVQRASGASEEKSQQKFL